MNRQNKPGGFYRWIKKLNPRLVQSYANGGGPTQIVLLLTTIGRKSGLPRTTPLQYEEIDGVFFVGSARGDQSDWYRNILVCPQVEVQVQDRWFRSTAEAVSDPVRIADFFELRIRRNFFIGLLMRMEGLPLFYRRVDLERFAAKKTMVILRPDSEIG